MFWNERVVRFNDGSLVICEVYYNDDDSLMGYADACLVADDIEEMSEIVIRLEECLTLPVLDVNDFPKGGTNET